MEVWLIYSIFLVSGVLNRDSAYVFQILFAYRLLQNTEYSSLSYAVGPRWLSILLYFTLFLAMPIACGSSWVRNRTQATAMTMSDP